MGQAPAIGRRSLRTVPRNFQGRSGTDDDQVYLCSPEVAAASALTGVITDPRRLDIPYPYIEEPKKVKPNTDMLLAPPKEGLNIELIKGENIKPIPSSKPMDNQFEGPVLIKLGDNITTDDIIPAGSNVLPFRSNIYKISQFIYERLDPSYHLRALEHQENGHFIIAGSNYGQGSSREHAALVPSYLGVRAVIVKSWARIHRANLINFGILPLEFINLENYNAIEQNDKLRIRMVRECLKKNEPIILENMTKNESYAVTHNLNERQIQIVLAGGIIGYHKF